MEQTWSPHTTSTEPSCSQPEALTASVQHNANKKTITASIQNQHVASQHEALSRIAWCLRHYSISIEPLCGQHEAFIAPVQHIASTNPIQHYASMKPVQHYASTKPSQHQYRAITAPVRSITTPVRCQNSPNIQPTWELYGASRMIVRHQNCDSMAPVRSQRGFLQGQ